MEVLTNLNMILSMIKLPCLKKVEGRGGEKRQEVVSRIPWYFCEGGKRGKEERWRGGVHK